MRTLILTPEMDDRFGQGKVRSRIGLEAEASPFSKREDLLQTAKSRLAEGPLHCVLVDEAQFHRLGHFLRAADADSAPGETRALERQAQRTADQAHAYDDRAPEED